MDWKIHQMDVKTLFSNGELKVDIYMDHLENFVHEGNEHIVHKFKKTLYMLKQLPRAWYHHIDLFLIDEG